MYTQKCKSCWCNDRSKINEYSSCDKNNIEKIILFGDFLVVTQRHIFTPNLLDKITKLR